MCNHEEYLAGTLFEGTAVNWELSFSAVHFQVFFFLKLLPKCQTSSSLLSRSHLPATMNM